MGGAPSKRNASSRRVRENKEQEAKGPLPFEQLRFQSKINTTISELEKILDITRHPQYPTTIHHQYADKFALVEFITNSSLAGVWNCLSLLGVMKKQELKKWAQDKQVTLRFRPEEQCAFLREAKHKDDETSFLGGFQKVSFSSGVPTKDYFWKYDLKYELSAFQGTNVDERLVFQERKAQCEIVVEDDQEAPKPKVSVLDPTDVNIKFLFDMITAEFGLNFQIDRLTKSSTRPCLTPRRNKNTDEAYAFFSSLYIWSKSIIDYFVLSVFPSQTKGWPRKDGYRAENIFNDYGVFVPVVPLFEKDDPASEEEPGPEEDDGTGVEKLPTLPIAPQTAPINTTTTAASSTGNNTNAASSTGEQPTPRTTTLASQSATASASTVKESPTASQQILGALGKEQKEPEPELHFPPDGSSDVVMSYKDVEQFLDAHLRSYNERMKFFEKNFSHSAKPVSLQQAKFLLPIYCIMSICQAFSDSVNYVEDMLRQQLVQAIGKELTCPDFSAFMNYHNNRIFKPAYKPVMLSYAIRRPGHYPEGSVGIEYEATGKDLPVPITTIVRKSLAESPMNFKMASTTIAFGGERYLHSYLSHQFSDSLSEKLVLHARARQFSSFVMMVGAIASIDLFIPKYAVVVQNKDDLKIPLMLNTIPSAKEFKDAIEALSPEQQRFAKAYRSMQLESTLFGVVVIQIKPALERVLNLPQNSLTKEIKLSQDLLNLFITYNIPSDLLSYDPRVDNNPNKRKQPANNTPLLKQLRKRASSESDYSDDLDESLDEDSIALGQSGALPVVEAPKTSGPVVFDQAWAVNCVREHVADVLSFINEGSEEALSLLRQQNNYEYMADEEDPDSALQNTLNEINRLDLQLMDEDLAIQRLQTETQNIGLTLDLEYNHEEIQKNVKRNHVKRKSDRDECKERSVVHSRRAESLPMSSRSSSAVANGRGGGPPMMSPVMASSLSMPCPAPVVQSQQQQSPSMSDMKREVAPQAESKMMKDSPSLPAKSSSVAPVSEVSGGKQAPVVADQVAPTPSTPAPSNTTTASSTVDSTPTQPTPNQPATNTGGQPQNPVTTLATTTQPSGHVSPRGGDLTGADDELGGPQEQLEVELVDYTLVPGKLEERFALDPENTIRPTIIKVGEKWDRRVQKGLMSAPYSESLEVKEQERERNKAFDLLDALSRSGNIVLEEACLHVVIASTHVFDESLINVIVKNNVNPIEKVERSTLIIASSILDVPPETLVRDEARPAIEQYSPLLFKDPSSWVNKPRKRKHHASKKPSKLELGGERRKAEGKDSARGDGERSARGDKAKEATLKDSEKTLTEGSERK